MHSKQINKEILDLGRKAKDAGEKVEGLKIEYRSATLACTRGELPAKKRNSVAARLREAQEEINRLELASEEAQLQLKVAEVNERRAGLEKTLAETRGLISGREKALERADAAIAGLDHALCEADEYSAKLRKLTTIGGGFMGSLTKGTDHDYFSGVMYNWLSDPYRDFFDRGMFTALGRSKRQTLSLRELHDRVHKCIISGMEEEISKCVVQN